MASKRMFSPDIVNSDSFIEMSLSAQALYFHLGMRADDDGFVNPVITMRMLGANNDDLKLLIAKRFVLPFESGVVVIKHWRMNNFIRRDRYKPTNYLDEIGVLRVKDNMAYTLDETQGIPVSESQWKSDSQPRLSLGQPDDIPTVDVGKDRIGKDRIGKVKKKKYGESENVFLSDDEYKKLTDKFGDTVRDDYIDKLGNYIASKGKQYKSHYHTILTWVRKHEEQSTATTGNGWHKSYD